MKHQNIQSKRPKNKWVRISVLCPGCLARAKKTLNQSQIQWRDYQGQFQVRAPNRDTIQAFFKAHKIGDH